MHQNETPDYLRYQEPNHHDLTSVSFAPGNIHLSRDDGVTISGEAAVSQHSPPNRLEPTLRSIWKAIRLRWLHPIQTWHAGPPKRWTLLYTIISSIPAHIKARSSPRKSTIAPRMDCATRSRACFSEPPSRGDRPTPAIEPTAGDVTSRPPNRGLFFVRFGSKLGVWGRSKGWRSSKQLRVVHCS